MLAVKVIFKDPTHNFSTDINGPFARVEKYYLNNWFNVDNYPVELMRQPTQVKLLRGE